SNSWRIMVRPPKPPKHKISSVAQHKPWHALRFGTKPAPSESRIFFQNVIAFLSMVALRLGSKPNQSACQQLAIATPLLCVFTNKPPIPKETGCYNSCYPFGGIAAIGLSSFEQPSPMLDNLPL